MHVCQATQSCLTLYDPRNYSPPGSSVHGILQARILERVAMSPPGNPDPEIEPSPPAAPAFQVDSLPLKHWRSPSLIITLNHRPLGYFLSTSLFQALCLYIGI